MYTYIRVEVWLQEQAKKLGLERLCFLVSSSSFSLPQFFSFLVVSHKKKETLFTKTVQRVLPYPQSICPSRSTVIFGRESDTLVCLWNRT